MANSYGVQEINMRTEGRTYILENRADLNDPVFKNSKSSNHYRDIPESCGWRVAVGFQKPNHPNWWETETDGLGYLKTFA